jgi:hypothetical protein
MVSGTAKLPRTVLLNQSPENYCILWHLSTPVRMNAAAPEGTPPRRIINKDCISRNHPSRYPRSPWRIANCSSTCGFDWLLHALSIVAYSCALNRVRGMYTNCEKLPDPPCLGEALMRVTFLNTKWKAHHTSGIFSEISHNSTDSTELRNPSQSISLEADETYIKKFRPDLQQITS